MFADRVLSISPGDRVLEVGPGAHPHPRSDVFLDRRFSDPSEAVAQRGYAPSAIPDERIVWYDGGRFPFEDQAFDYVICSHVLEHVPPPEFEEFVTNLQRVASRGYLEVPSVFYELINYQAVHHWFISYRDNELLLLDKRCFQTSPLHQAFRAMFYCPDRFGRRFFKRYPEFFFIGFEWTGSVRCRRVDSLEELVTEADLEAVRHYFDRFTPELAERKSTAATLVDGARRRASKLLRAATSSSAGMKRACRC